MTFGFAKIENPKISIIVPVYKVEKWIHQCIDSLINQTLKDIEIICIDDGSPDNCGKILDNYAKQDDRITVIHQKNKGVSSARNAGIDKSKGEYITFVDSDDYVEKEAYETAYKWAKEDNVDLLQMGHRTFKDGEEEKNIKHKNFSNSKVLNLEEFLKKNNYFVWSKIFKSEIIKRDNIKFVESIPLAEDTCFSHMVFPGARKFKVIPGKFYNYRIREGSAVRTWNREKFDNKYMLDIIHSVYDSWNKRNLIEGREHILLKYIFDTIKSHITKSDYADEILNLINEKLNSEKVLAKCPSWIKEEIKNLNCASKYNRINPIKEGVYRIECASNNKMVLDINNASNKNGAKLQIWNSNNTNAQKFEIKRVRGYYSISPLCSRKLVDVKDGNKNPGAEVQQWEGSSTIGNRQWYIVPCGDGNFKIISKLNFLALDSNDSKKGTKVLCQNDNNSISQKFKFIKI